MNMRNVNLLAEFSQCHGSEIFLFVCLFVCLLLLQPEHFCSQEMKVTI